jgi:N-acetylglucosamine kinase-like BadF-type ATPase
LTLPILAALQINDIREIMHRIYHPRPDRATIAALAPIVAELASSDAVARSIVDRGCVELTRIVVSLVRKLAFTGTFPIVPMGGLAASSPIFSELLKEQLTAALPQAILTAPRASALAGAAILALREYDVDIDGTILKKLQQIY